MEPGVSGLSGVPGRGSEEQSDTHVKDELRDRAGDVCVPASTASSGRATGRATGLQGVVGLLAGVSGTDFRLEGRNFCRRL